MKAEILLAVGLITCFDDAQAQINWSQDVSWADQGWCLVGEGHWQQPLGAVPWQEDLAIASTAFDADGDSQPMVWRVQENGQADLLSMPIIDSLKIQLQSIYADTGGNLRAWANGIGLESGKNGGISSEWMQLKWSGNGTESPEVNWFSFGSPFQSVLGWADASTNDAGYGLALGYVLDPCCFHKEMPALVMTNAEGLAVPGFGETGAVIVDLNDGIVLDTLGLSAELNRHEIGGYYSCAAQGPDGCWYTGGAYSNAYHYELLLAKHLSNGELDETFGTDGWVHMNLSPGHNHSVKSIHLDGEYLIALLEHETTEELNAGWNQVTFDLSGTAIGMQTLEFGEAWSESGFLLLPNSVAMGIGSDPQAGINGIYLISPFGNTPTAEALSPSMPWEGGWGHVHGVFHPDWGQLITVGQWNAGDLERPLLAARWNIASNGSDTEVSHEIMRNDFPYPNPMHLGEQLTLPCSDSSESQKAWTLYDHSGRILANGKMTQRCNVTLPVHLKSGSYIISTGPGGPSWPLGIQ